MVRWGIVSNGAAALKWIMIYPYKQKRDRFCQWKLECWPPAGNFRLLASFILTNSAEILLHHFKKIKWRFCLFRRKIFFLLVLFFSFSPSLLLLLISATFPIWAAAPKGTMMAQMRVSIFLCIHTSLYVQIHLFIQTSIYIYPFFLWRG